MNMPRIAILAAVAANRVIGRENTLPWHLPADLKHFKALTMGQIIVMGRRTFDSIGRPLTGRVNVVLTRQPALQLPGVEIATSMEAVLDRFRGDARKIFIIGGAELFKQTLPDCDRLYITEIEQVFSGDTFFPEFGRGDWLEISRETNQDASTGLIYHFLVMERIHELV